MPAHAQKSPQCPRTWILEVNRHRRSESPRRRAAGQRTYTGRIRSSPRGPQQLNPRSTTPLDAGVRAQQHRHCRPGLSRATRGRCRARSIDTSSRPRYGQSRSREHTPRPPGSGSHYHHLGEGHYPCPPPPAPGHPTTHSATSRPASTHLATTEPAERMRCHAAAAAPPPAHATTVPSPNRHIPCCWPPDKEETGPLRHRD